MLDSELQTQVDWLIDNQQDDSLLFELDDMSDLLVIQGGCDEW